MGSGLCSAQQGVQRGQKCVDGDFPSGPVVKNLSSSVEDKGLIPDQRTKVLQRGTGNKTRVLQLLGLMLHNQRSLCNEKASCCNKRRSPVLQLEKPLQTTTRESPDAATKTQHGQNKKKENTQNVLMTVLQLLASIVLLVNWAESTE